ncbi:hypothetical protein D3C87_1470960 [compost metagenome]
MILNHQRRFAIQLFAAWIQIIGTYDRTFTVKDCELRMDCAFTIFLTLPLIHIQTAVIEQLIELTTHVC